MAEKKKTEVTSVGDFLRTVSDQQRRSDCQAIGKMMHAATGKRAKMEGSSIVGYGSYDYQYANGKTGTSVECGYSPRASSISIYIMPGFSEFGAELKKLGKHKTGRSCLYINRLADVDEKVLATIISRSVKIMRKKYGAKS